MRAHKLCGCVATCGVARSSEHEPRVAYCPLHASAPDLLAALEKYVEHAERRSSHACCDEVDDMARAAIRKASGTAKGEAP